MLTVLVELLMVSLLPVPVGLISVGLMLVANVDRGKMEGVGGGLEGFQVRYMEVDRGVMASRIYV